MKIEKLILRNIQRHKNLTIELGRGNNAVLGHNNAGKSSVVRACRWLLTNSPLGTWMCREVNGKVYEASIKMVFDDGSYIIRANGPKNGNVYKFNSQKFTGFGRSIPEPIVEHIGKIVLELGNVELTPSISTCVPNEPPFLLDQTAPMRGSILNYLTGIDIADKIKRELNKSIRADKKETKWLDGKVQSVEVELEQYGGIDELSERAVKLKKAYGKYQDIKEKLKERKKVKTKSSKLRKAIEEKKAAIVALRPLVNRYATLCRLEELLGQLTSVSNQLPGLRKVVATGSRISTLKVSIQTVQLLEECNRLSKAVQKRKSRVKVLEEQLQEFDVCPECGRPL